jgi:uncharacterized protein YndB with AHSA1/START domain
MRIAADVVIDKHIDEVFEFVANPLNDPRWCGKVLYVEQTEGDEPGPGAEYAVVHRPIPFRPPRRMRYVCVDWDPPNRIVWREDDGHDVIDVVYALESVWTATRLTQEDTAQLGAPSVLRPVVKAGIRRDMKRQLRSLRRVLERS